MRNKILNVFVALCMSLLMFSCQKDTSESTTSLLIGVWTNTQTEQQVYNGVTTAIKDVRQLIISENNTFALKWTFYINDKLISTETVNSTGTYSYDEKTKYLTLVESSSKEIELVKIISLSGSEMKTEIDNIQYVWTK